MKGCSAICILVENSLLFAQRTVHPLLQFADHIHSSPAVATDDRRGVPMATSSPDPQGGLIGDAWQQDPGPPAIG